MTVNSSATRDRIIAAAKRIWDSSPDVKSFALRFEDSAVDESSGGWEFPVMSDLEDPNAYDLARALERIQEQLEGETGEFVTVYLDLGS